MRYNLNIICSLFIRDLRAKEDAIEVEVDDVCEVCGLHHHSEHVLRDAGVVD